MSGVLGTLGPSHCRSSSGHKRVASGSRHLSRRKRRFCMDGGGVRGSKRNLL